MHGLNLSDLTLLIPVLTHFHWLEESSSLHLAGLLVKL